MNALLPGIATPPPYRPLHDGWIIGIDPGPKVSAFVILDPDGQRRAGAVISSTLMARYCLGAFAGIFDALGEGEVSAAPTLHRLVMAVEIMGHVRAQAFIKDGKAVATGGVGDETFETAYLIGRFIDRGSLHMPVIGLKRDAVKRHLGVTPQAAKKAGSSGDVLVRQNLLARFGVKDGPGESKGCLDGCTTHQWAALAVACTVRDTGVEKWISFPKL